VNPRTALLAPLVLVLVASGGCLQGLFGGVIEPTDYLHSTYTKWVIEVDYAQGERPSDSVLALLKQRMEAVVNKPDGVEIRIGDELPRDERKWTTRALMDMRQERQDERTRGNTVVTHVAFVAGQYSEGRVLGVAIGHEQVVIFSQTIENSCSTLQIPPCFYSKDEILRAVVVHEFGHILGLVNNGIGMVQDHEDSEHRGHSSNRNSVMYWAVETTDIFRAFSGGIPTTFDADDRDDLRTAGGK